MSTSDSSQRGGRAAAGERAYHWVKERILDGRMEGGDLISEGEVAAGTGMSRTPVREAFLRLEVEGLLRLFPKRGALIVPVSAAEVADVTEARILLETYAGEKVIQEGRNRAVAEAMRAILDEQLSVPMPGSEGEFSALDRRFHETLVTAAGNGLVDHFYTGLRDRQIRMFNSALQRVPDRHSQILDEHEKLCSLLRDGDSATLRDALSVHISATHGALR